MDSFQNRIKLLRKENNLSQYALAAEINSSQKIIDYWEKGASEPKMHFIIRLADFFGVSCDYLLGREDDFGNVNVNANLSEEERVLLSSFQKLDKNKKANLLSYLEFLEKQET